MVLLVRFSRLLFFAIFACFKDKISKSYHPIFMNRVSKLRKISPRQKYASFLQNLCSKKNLEGGKLEILAKKNDKKWKIYISQKSNITWEIRKRNFVSYYIKKVRPKNKKKRFRNFWDFVFWKFGQKIDFFSLNSKISKNSKKVHQ